MSEKYLANRLKYHAASRVAAKEADPLLNALNLDGHTVLTSKVWASPASEFPVNTGDNKTTTNSTQATNDLVTVFKDGGVSQEFYSKINNEQVLAGTVWTNSKYPAVKLFENVEMSPVVGSNGSGTKYEAYEILDASGIRVMDWVSPMAAFDASVGKPTPGFGGKVEVFKGSTWTELQNCGDVKGMWALAEGNWEFIYNAGIVTFNADHTPTQYSYTKVRWTGFQYIGKYLDKFIEDKLDEIDTAIESSAELFDVQVPLVSPYAGGNAAVASVNIAGSVVTIVINGKVTEVLADDGEELIPTQTYSGGKTTLTADFDGTPLDPHWVITYRVLG